MYEMNLISSADLWVLAYFLDNGRNDGFIKMSDRQSAVTSSYCLGLTEEVEQTLRPASLLV